MTKKFRITLAVEAETASGALRAIEECDCGLEDPDIPEITSINVEEVSKFDKLFARGGYTSPTSMHGRYVL